MLKNFDYLNFINELVQCSPRQFGGEIKAANLIENYLNDNNIDFQCQEFKLNVPLLKKTIAVVDGKQTNGIEACCFVSGKIKDKENIISSLISSQRFIDDSNINFNPLCSVVSASNHYFAPSVAVDHESLKKIIAAEKVEIEIKVTAKSHTAKNILVGNLKSPKHICFAHYDSIKKGAIDNASGVSLMMGTILENKNLLNDSLFVFAAAEELSYDHPVYWGHGFRAFEEKYSTPLNKTQKIVVIDCVGNGKAKVMTDKKYLKLGFPIKKIEKLQHKVSLLSADVSKLMEVYHSDLDDGRQIELRYMYEAVNSLKKIMR